MTTEATVIAPAAPAVPEVRNELIITIEGQDSRIPLNSLQLTMDSTERQILDAVRPLMQEQRGIDINDGADYTYTVRMARNSNCIYIYPKPVAG